MKRRVLAAACALIAGSSSLGCGTPSADLFVVQRSGAIPGARVKLLVSDGGTVRCNGGAERTLGDQRLLDARDIERDLEPLAKGDLVMAAGPNAVLRYDVLLEDGSVRFSDTSPGQPLVLRRVAAFTRDVSIHVCRLPR